MIINDGKILRNGGRIFKSQVTDSFVEFNATAGHQVHLELSGASINNPLYMYFKKPTITEKFTLASTSSPFITLTNEGSYKKFYFSGNLDSVRGIRFSGVGNYYWNGRFYRGDLIKLMNQFPNLYDFRITDSLGAYYRSQFNKNITNTSFPNQIKIFHIADNTLSGDISTIKNFEKIEDLLLVLCQLSGNISDVEFTNLRKLKLQQLNNITGTLDGIINDSLESLHIQDCNNLGGDGANWDVSNLNYFYLYIYSNYNISGDISDWVFNTGLTHFQLQNRLLDGDITNWDFSNTQLTNFHIYNAWGNYDKISGSLSGWTFPVELEVFQLSSLTGITSIPFNFSANTNLQTFSIASVPLVEQNIGDFIFADSLEYLYFYDTKLYGDINDLYFSSGLYSFQLSNCDVGGNIEDLQLPDNLQDLDINNTSIIGNPALLVLPEWMYYVNLSYNTGLTLNLNESQLILGNYMESYNISNIGGVVGSLSDIIFNYLDGFSISLTPCNSDLSEFDINNVGYLDASECEGLFGDLTNWIDGNNNLYGLNIGNNELLSGDTSGWGVDNCQSFWIGQTNLSGALKHYGIYYCDISYTKISSNIETDLGFNGLFLFYGNDTEITGNLSGVTLSYDFYIFNVSNCPNLLGTNEFITYFFENRRNWSRTWGISIIFHNIGDVASGSVEELGDLGTWGGSEWDLSEEQVNNLVAGTDYDGNGTNTPWNSKQKVWWMVYALESSLISQKRYVNLYFSYS